MPEQTVHCLTADGVATVEIEGAASQWELPLSVVSYRTLDDALTLEAPGPADVAVVDGDLAGSRVEELLQRCRGIPTVVIASPGGEETLNRAHALHGSEFLLKDPEGHYALLLPTLIRKLLRQEDRDETTRDIIRSSEERYRSLIEALPDIVYKIDPNGYFTFVNASVRKLGYEPEELIGQHFSIIVDEEDLTRVSRRKVLRDFEGYETGAGSAPGLFDERRTGERRTTGLEIRLKRRGLSQSDNRDRIIASLISYGEITATGHYRTEKARRYFTGTVGIIRDVTERKQSQKRLRQLSFAVEQISTALCITDGDGVVDYANPSFFRLNDVRPEDVFGIRASEVFAGYLQEDEEGELARVLRGTRFWEADRIVWTRSGDSVWCWFRVYPLFDVEQQVSQYVLFQEDITDRKQRELVLARSAESHQDVLRMIHHRVSANLAALRTQDADADELSRRMRAQILVHEIMHQSGSFDRLDMVRYLEELPPAVLAERSARGRLDVQLEELVLGINAGLPLALATAECLATLWPPPDAHTRTFTAVLEEEDPAALVVRFEGEDPFDGGPNSVIETLIAQVDGTFSHEPGEIRLSFRFDAPEIPSQEAPS